MFLYFCSTRLSYLPLWLGEQDSNLRPKVPNVIFSAFDQKLKMVEVMGIEPISDALQVPLAPLEHVPPYERQIICKLKNYRSSFWNRTKNNQCKLTGIRSSENKKNNKLL